MPTTWEQMFDTGRDASVATEAEEEERRGLFSRMRESLSKSRRAMTQQLTAVMFDPADADVWERLEEALIYADCGVAATVEVIERLEGEADAGGLRSAEELGDRLAAIVAELMRPTGDPRIDVRNRQWQGFMLAGAFAGIAGALFAFSKGSISPETLAIPRSIDVLVMVLLGGLNALFGPLIGAAAFTWLQDTLARVTEYWRAFVGAGILVLILAFPQGVGGAFARLTRKR